MRIGELAESTGTAVETIRFYEREGLVPAAQRADNNYRVYTAAHAERLAFIRHCRNLDMTLDEIRTLLRLRDAPSQDCGEVNALLTDVVASGVGAPSTRASGWACVDIWGAVVSCMGGRVSASSTRRRAERRLAGGQRSSQDW